MGRIGGKTRNGRGQSDAPRARLSLPELERSLRSRDPAVRLVLPRILRRVIREDCDLGGWGWRVPHRKSYVIGRERLLEIVEPAELGPEPPRSLPEKLILLPQPTPEHLAEVPRGDVLIHYWRLLFHARVHAALEEQAAADKLSLAEVRRRIGRIGPTAFDEARTVLREEHFLLPPRDDRAVYVEFAAVYLEMKHFAASLLPRYFPAIESPQSIEAVLEEDLDANGLYRATRPAGAPEPQDVPEPEEFDEWMVLPEPPEDGGDEVVEPPQAPSEAKYHRLTGRADQAAAVGNLVRSAILRCRAERIAPRRLAARARTAVKQDVDRLAHRLHAALELREEGPQPGQESLAVLVRQAARGFWTAEGRLLYDLQKVCVDAEREIHTVDLVEWLLTRGKRPIKRPLPGQRDVLMSRHLDTAARRLAGVRLTDHQRQHLSALVRAGIERTERRIRDRFRPQIAAALDAVGLVPRNVPERVARNKVIEEMLDRIVERGYLSMGDFRDALSRNNLKLPDLSPLAPTPAAPTDRRGKRRAAGRGLGSWAALPLVWAYAYLAAVLRGDELLRADRLLGVSLDGVYRRGEFYLRWMQRFIALAFGTRTGRFLTRYLAVPFVGAFLALAGTDHLIEIFHKLAAPAAPVAAVYVPWEISEDSSAEEEGLAEERRASELAPEAAEPESGVEHALEPALKLSELWEPPASEPVLKLRTPASTVLLGILLLGLINVEGFRRIVWRGIKTAYRGLRTLLVELPLRLFRLPWVQWVLRSQPAVLAFRFLLKPAALTLLLGPLVVGPVRTWQASAGRAAGVFLVINVVLNSRAGRNVEEMISDWVVQTWHRFGLRLLVNLFSLVMDLFKQILKTIERLLYAVDEWLRFRSGESRLVFWLKAVLGLLWFFVAYVVRFCVTLLIEPQVNPIKHFPVVTVSHKLLLGFIPHFAGLLSYTMDKAVAATVATLVITSIPGIFGFLVWELKENWRLYAANRPGRLGPVPIGSHGETMPRLMRRGLHSGTLPKRFAKLRRAERRARLKRNWKAVRKHLFALHRVEVDLRRYFERELVALLAASDRWRAGPVRVDHVHLGPTALRIDLSCPDASPAPMAITVEARSGWLLAGVLRPGWAGQLAPEQRQTLNDALLGLCKTAGADLIHQHVEAALPPQSLYTLSERALVVWPEGTFQTEVLYDLAEENGRLVPQVVAGTPRGPMPVLERSQVLFREIPIGWQRWVAAWEPDGTGGAAPREPLAPICLFPAVAPDQGTTPSGVIASFLR